MDIKWTHDLSVGDEKIDFQHQELLKRLNFIWMACSRGAGQEEVNKVVGCFEDYVVIHFNYEENLMAVRQYEGLAAHKEKHQEFIIKFDHIKERLIVKIWTFMGGLYVEKFFLGIFSRVLIIYFAKVMLRNDKLGAPLPKQ